MLVSTIIPTIGRSTLERTVCSVLQQQLAADQFEIIVVNDTGVPLPPQSWQQAENVQVITTNRRERSIARNCGAAVAKGDFLHFLDDDDWMYPDAFVNLSRMIDQAPGAVWYYGGVTLVDETGSAIGELNLGADGNIAIHALAGSWLPLQASFIAATAFFEVGQFNARMFATQDLDLSRRLAARGAFQHVDAAVAFVQRGLAGWQSSTDYQQAPEFNRESRHQLLNSPGVYRRLLASTGRMPYWHGRLVQAYLSSLIFAVRRREGTAVLNRLFFATISLLLAGTTLFSPDFWQALRDDRVPYTSAAIIQAYQAALHPPVSTTS